MDTAGKVAPLPQNPSGFWFQAPIGKMERCFCCQKNILRCGRWQRLMICPVRPAFHIEPESLSKAASITAHKSDRSQTFIPELPLIPKTPFSSKRAANGPLCEAVRACPPFYEKDGKNKGPLASLTFKMFSSQAQTKPQKSQTAFLALAQHPYCSQTGNLVFLGCTVRTALLYPWINVGRHVCSQFVKCSNIDGNSSHTHLIKNKYSQPWRIRYSRIKTSQNKQLLAYNIIVVAVPKILTEI